MSAVVNDHWEISGEKEPYTSYPIEAIAAYNRWGAEPNPAQSNEPGTDHAALPQEVFAVAERAEPATEVLTGAEAWLQSAAQTTLLTHEQEIALAQRIESARTRHDPRAEQRAREQLISANLRLVAFIARRYTRRGIPIEDLMQEGSFGLIRAVERFDWRKGLRFSTYAAWWIRSSITRAVSEQAGLIRLPAHINGTLSRVRQVRDSLSADLGRTPTQTEIAEAMGMTETALSRLMRGAAEPLSLETPCGEEGDLRLADLIPAGMEHDPVTRSTQDALREAVSVALEDLDLRESKVLCLRYGLNGDDPLSLEETSRTLLVTRERVRMLEVRALRKLRGRGLLQRLMN